jgi:hypothetical protein
MTALDTAILVGIALGLNLMVLAIVLVSWRALERFIARVWEYDRLAERAEEQAERGQQ